MDTVYARQNHAKSWLRTVRSGGWASVAVCDVTAGSAGAFWARAVAVALPIARSRGAGGFGQRRAARDSPIDNLAVLAQQALECEHGRCAIRIALVKGNDLQGPDSTVWILADEVVESRGDPKNSCLPTRHFIGVDVLHEIPDVSKELGLSENVTTETRQQLAIAQDTRVVGIVERDVADVVEPCRGSDALDGVAVQSELARQRDGIDR